MSKPMNLREWQSYIDRLAGEALWSKAVAANTERFIQTLRDEGFQMAEIEGIMTAFANQFAITGQSPPRTGAYRLSDLADENIIPMSDAEVVALAQMADMQPEDELVD